MQRGRKSKYDTHIKPYLETIKRKVCEGATERDLAKALGVSHTAWNEYKAKYPEFAAILKMDEDATRIILEHLDNAMLKSASGYDYTEKKQFFIFDDNGERILAKEEVTKKHIPPNVTAIFGAYNRFDKNYKKDAAYYELKLKELELKQKIAEANNFLDLEGIKNETD